MVGLFRIALAVGGLTPINSLKTIGGHTKGFVRWIMPPNKMAIFNWKLEDIADACNVTLEQLKLDIKNGLVDFSDFYSTISYFIDHAIRELRTNYDTKKIKNG